MITRLDIFSVDVDAGEASPANMVFSNPSVASENNFFKLMEQVLAPLGDLVGRENKLALPFDQSQQPNLNEESEDDLGIPQKSDLAFNLAAIPLSQPQPETSFHQTITSKKEVEVLTKAETQSGDARRFLSQPPSAKPEITGTIPDMLAAPKADVSKGPESNPVLQKALNSAVHSPAPSVDLPSDTNKVRSSNEPPHLTNKNAVTAVNEGPPILIEPLVEQKGQNSQTTFGIAPVENKEARTTTKEILSPHFPPEAASSANDLPAPLRKVFTPAEIPQPIVLESPQKPLQMIAEKQVIPSAVALESALPPDGKEAAKQEASMRFTGEQNKFAENTLQNLPRFGAREETFVVSPEKTVPKFISAQPERQITSLDVPAVDWFAASGAMNSEKTSLATTPGVVDQPLPQIDHVTRVVSAEVLAFKHTGANSMTVSLKLDAQTEISLGLTNQDGKIQASIRCERGELSGTEGHWDQLQESLARHNVQLLPLQQNHSPKVPTSGFPSDASQNFEQPQQRQDRGRPPVFSVEETFSASISEGSKLGKSNKVVARRGWESWA